ncbi:lipopolysaccharide assembly protein LapA domain-containing protein [Nocardioides litoris]|uniref:lipopolysaccharide assembly protein LapA domain-containing protein n=1 Tax=Nocardioides litoris TaxID=1926648 RepID=UPI0011236DFB|nr:lipopolysaccharide assembly protein LapA domain-containing protein [Nocardioides litoris]
MTSHDTPTDRGSRSDRSRRLSPKQVVGIVVLVLVAIFCAQNTGRTTIQFFGGETQSPLWVWLLGVLVVGVLVGFVLGYRKKG